MAELAAIVRSIGYEIIEHRSEFCWHIWEASSLSDFMRRSGFDMANRGDDQFLVVTKPANATRLPHGLNLPVA